MRSLFSCLRSPRAFTLIELLVVILVIGILIAVAAPSFLGQTEKAEDSAAKQYLTVAYKAAKAYSVDGNGAPGHVQGNFDGFNALALDAMEPGLDPLDGTCPGSAAGLAHNQVVIDTTATTGNNLTICNDPDSTIWTLKVVGGILQPIALCQWNGTLCSNLALPPTYSETILATSSLLHYWQLGEASGTTAIDSAQGFNGSYLNSPQLGVAGATTEAGKKAVAFSAPANQRVSVPFSYTYNLRFPNNDPFSIEAWVNPASASDNSAVASCLNSGTGWSLFVTTSQVQFRRFVSSNQDTAGFNRTPYVPLNIWTHVVAVYDGASLHLYSNGVLRVSAPSSAAVPATGASCAPWLAANDGNFPWDGTLDEIAVYGSALSASQVANHYNLGVN